MGTHHEGPILSMFILIMLANGFVETYGKTGNQVEIKIKMNLGWLLSGRRSRWKKRIDILFQIKLWIQIRRGASMWTKILNAKTAWQKRCVKTRAEDSKVIILMHLSLRIVSGVRNMYVLVKSYTIKFVDIFFWGYQLILITNQEYLKNKVLLPTVLLCWPYCKRKVNHGINNLHFPI